jgi:hypothetical protein
MGIELNVQMLFPLKKNNGKKNILENTFSSQPYPTLGATDPVDPQ